MTIQSATDKINEAARTSLSKKLVQKQQQLNQANQMLGQLQTQIREHEIQRDAIKKQLDFLQALA